MASIPDLSADLDFSPDPYVVWTFNLVQDLGCGTVYVPPFQSFGLPQETWYQSAVPTVRDRGIYGGINYNRQRQAQITTELIEIISGAEAL